MNQYNDIKEGIAKGFLRNQYNHVKGVALLLDETNNNQAYLYSVLRSRMFLENNAGVDIQFYSISNEKPILMPRSGLFSINELDNFVGDCISTSLHNLTYMFGKKRYNKWFYVYDLTELFRVDKNILKEYLKEVKVFTRNDDYRKILKDYFNIDTLENNVPDFNIEKIMKNLGIQI